MPGHKLISIGGLHTHWVHRARHAKANRYRYRVIEVVTDGKRPLPERGRQTVWGYRPIRKMQKYP